MSTAGHRRRTINNDVSATTYARPRRSTVLVVESHDDTRELYAEFLQASGFDVMTSDTTDDALTRIAGADAVVTGLAVRGSENAFSLIRRIRDADTSVRRPILVVTAHAFEANRQEALHAGADVFLAKPCLPGTVEQELRRLLRLLRIGKAKPAVASPARRRSRRIG